jgi:rsbT co-antagonist protein RsbR
VPVVDSQVAQGLLQVVAAARLLGAVVVLVGIRPEVAQALVGLGIDMRTIRTFSDLQSALAAGDSAPTLSSARAAPVGQSPRRSNDRER